MSYTGIRQLVDESYLGGKYWYSSFHKLLNEQIWASAINIKDFSMAPGNPIANTYSGTALTATEADSSLGIYHGGSVSPATKHLHKITAIFDTVSEHQIPLILCDYLIYYPVIDMESVALQTLDNTITLPRYTTGDGVRAFLVTTADIAVSHGTKFVMTYTDAAGVSDRVSIVTCAANIRDTGVLVHAGGSEASMQGTFIDLVPGSTGVRSVQSIQFLDVNHGTACLVLCKPLVTVFSAGNTAPSEWDFMIMKPLLPRIYDEACLNFLGAINGGWNTGNIFEGDIGVIWN